MLTLKNMLARVLPSIWYGENAVVWVLWPFGKVYEYAAVIRRRLYGIGILPVRRFDVPVIVIGNLTVGGTGKTPVTIWLALMLRRRDLTVGIVCSGYGGKAESWPQVVTTASDPSEVGDEPILLALRTRCPVVAAPDRVAAVKRLLQEAKVDVVLSDDGLQHYRLGRIFELAVVDGERGLGNGLCLPAGPLREPPQRLREVDATVVNGGDWGHAGVLRCEMKAVRGYELRTGTESTLDSFKGQHVHAVAGIGHPERFFHLLESHGLVVEPHPLPDHAEITVDDLAFDDDDPVFVTEKDAVKCHRIAGPNVWCLVAQLQFASGDDDRLLRFVMRELN